MKVTKNQQLPFDYSVLWRCSFCSNPEILDQEWSNIQTPWKVYATDYHSKDKLNIHYVQNMHCRHTFI